ncbi:hypothetical protein ACGFZS_38555 [Streptomyces sp. NPDC048288]|uniref:hypothetical protein n=1 Tax=Streptomyces sp. NPDC048288 TaxID=3365529 RepID=UPI003720411F
MATLVSLLLTGCDAASGGVADGLNVKPPPQASAMAVSGRLTKAALAGQQVEGFVVTAVPAAEAAGRREVKASRDVCAPAGHVLSTTVVGNPTSTVVRRVSNGRAVVTVVLAEYDEGKSAQSALDVLAAAIDECADGFTAAVDDERRTYSRLVPELAPEGADQAMAWGAVVERDGVKAPVKAVVFRKGATVGYLTAVPEGSALKDFSVPDAVVDAQLAKLS